MKGTLRRNGKVEVTKRITYHVTLDDIALLVAQEYEIERMDGESLTKRQVEQAVDNGLQQRGQDNLFFGHEKISYDSAEQQEALDWARREITRLYPEFNQ